MQIVIHGGADKKLRNIVGGPTMLHSFSLGRFFLAKLLAGRAPQSIAYCTDVCARFCTSMLTSCSGDSVSSSMPQLFTHS